MLRDILHWDGRTVCLCVGQPRFAGHRPAAVCRAAQSCSTPGIDSTVRTHDEPRKNGDMSKYCSDDNDTGLLADIDQTVNGLQN